MVGRLATLRPPNMHARLVVIIGLVAAIAGSAAANNEECVPEAADPATYDVLDLPDGTRLYLNSRCRPLSDPLTQDPTPYPCNAVTAFVLGDGFFIYQEANGLPGLQRGGVNALLCENPLGEPDPFCTAADPINDENCGRGPDRMLF